MDTGVEKEADRETGEQMYDNRDVQGGGGEEFVTRQIVTYIRTQVDAIGRVYDYSAPGGSEEESKRTRARLALASRR